MPASVTKKPPREKKIGGKAGFRSTRSGANIARNYVCLSFVHRQRVSVMYLLAGMSANLITQLIVFVFDTLRSVFKCSCLFLRPRPWQFEI